MLIHVFLHFLHNYIHLYSKSDSNLSDHWQITAAIETNYLLYIFMVSSTYLVLSDNIIMFNLILTIILLYFVVTLKMCI